MKSTLLSALLSFLILSFSSASFAYFEEHIRCQSKEDVRFALDLVNHPDIELASYDSAKNPDSVYGGEIKSELLVNGRKVATQVRSLSVARGTVTDVTRRAPNGKICIIGNIETGIQYVAAVKVGNARKTVQFRCTNTSRLPDETMYCE